MGERFPLEYFITNFWATFQGSCFTEPQSGEAHLPSFTGYPAASPFPVFRGFGGVLFQLLAVRIDPHIKPVETHDGVRRFSCSLTKGDNPAAGLGEKL
jgi:hypothetical protein